MSMLEVENSWLISAVGLRAGSFRSWAKMFAFNANVSAINDKYHICNVICELRIYDINIPAKKILSIGYRRHKRYLYCILKILL